MSAGPEIMKWVARAALIVAKKGPEIEKTMLILNSGTKTFSFLRSSDPNHALYQQKLTETRTRLQLEEEGVETDLDAFAADMDDAVSSATMPPPELVQNDSSTDLDAFAHMDDAVSPATMPSPERLFVPSFSDLRNPSFRFPASGITPEDLGVMKLTLQFEARYGLYFFCDLLKLTGIYYPWFEFLNPCDSRFNFYCGLASAYSRVLKSSKLLKKRGSAWTETVREDFFHRLQLWKLKPMDMAVIDLHAFVSGLDCFAHMVDVDYSSIMAQPQRLSMMINQMHPRPLGSHQPDAPATTHHDCELESLKELCIIKFTAMYVARYGMHFCQDLMKIVAMKPQFQFMEPSNSKFSLYNVVVDAYSRVLEPCYDACTETLLADFFRCLRLEKLEGAAIIDLHAFVSGIDYFAYMEDVDYSALMPPPQLLSVTMNRIPSLRRLLPLSNNSSVCFNGPHGTRQFAKRPKFDPPSMEPEAKKRQRFDPSMEPEAKKRQRFDPSMEPEAKKRQRFDESALVPVSCSNCGSL